MIKCPEGERPMHMPEGPAIQRLGGARKWKIPSSDHNKPLRGDERSDETKDRAGSNWRERARRD